MVFTECELHGFARHISTAKSRNDLISQSCTAHTQLTRKSKWVKAISMVTIIQDRCGPTAFVQYAPNWSKLHQLSFLPSFSHVFVSRAVSCQVSTSPARFRMARTSQRKSAKSVKVSSECQIQRGWSSRCIMSQQLLRMWSHPQLYDLSSDTGIWFSGASLYVPHICSWQDVQPAWNAHLEAEYFYLALSFAMVRSKSKHSSLDSAKLSILERSCRADLDNRAASFQAMLKTTSLSLLILQYVLGRFCSDSSFKIFQVPISALDFPSISIRICCQPFLWSQPPWDWRLSSFIPLSCPKILQSCRFCSRQTFQESA